MSKANYKFCEKCGTKVALNTSQCLVCNGKSFLEAPIVSYAKYCIEAIRFAKLPKFVKDLAWKLDLKLEINVDSGLLYETVRFKITGNTEVVEEFDNILKKSIKDYESL